MNAKRRKRIDKAANLLRDCVENLVEAKNILGEVAGEERDYYDNMSVGGDKAEQAERAAETLEEVYTALEEFDADDLVGKLEEAKE
jgi:hypothetical protein